MLEYIAPAFVYSLLKDGWTALRGTRRRLSPSETATLRSKRFLPISMHSDYSK
jgi:hypothetical protein